MAYLPSPHPPSAADRIAQACLATYHPLEAKYKPKARSNGVREWTVLAGIVLHSTSSLKGKEKATAEDDEGYTCVSLGTGVKVLSERALPVHGDALHDSHAEVLARRGFVCFLLQEAQRHRDGAQSPWVEPSEDGSMQLREGVEVHLYVSTLPVRALSLQVLISVW
jgi:tRNA-specific adenosine deaminase 1